MKKSRKEREKDIRDDGFKKTSGVNYDAISDRQVGDKRFERERAHKINDQAKGMAGLKDGPTMSSTFDAFQRMAAGLEGRTIADKISDPNRPTWEQYKKENEEKLDLVGNEVRKMVEYRAQLDKERDERLQRGTNHGKKSKAISDSSEDDSSSDSESESGSDAADGSKHKRKRKKDKKHKDKEKKHKKHKKDKKSKKKRRSDDSDGSDGDNDKHSSRKKRDSGKSNEAGSMRLSDFMKSGYDSD